MIKRTIVGLLVIMTVATGIAWAHEGQGEAGEAVPENTGKAQQLTGEVVDVACYLEHGAQGLGAGHADCAKKCIQSGLPVAIKVGDQLYVASMASHDPANKTLAQYAGQQVVVHGKVLEQDGQHLVMISQVEPAH